MYIHMYVYIYMYVYANVYESDTKGVLYIHQAIQQGGWRNNTGLYGRYWLVVNVN